MNDVRKRKLYPVSEQRGISPAEPVKKPFFGKRDWQERGCTYCTVVGAVATVVVGAVLLGVLGPFGATRGAPRSVRLEWEKRAAEIDAAIAQQDSGSSAVETQGRQ